MSLNDFKVREEDFTANDIVSLSDRPSADGMSAAALKKRFDAGAKQVIAPKLNALIEFLAGESGASGIGLTAIEGLAGYNLQDVLIAIKILIDGKKNAEESNNELALKFDAADAQSLVKDVQIDLATGVITVTKQDGSFFTYDTALEKVALDVRLEGQQFVLTLADGTEQRVDLSAFISEIDVKNSETINLTIENNQIVARIAAKSVTVGHLADEVVAYFNEKVAEATASASVAAVSETNALLSANKAGEYTESALQSASSASISATSALQSAERAENAAERAETIAGGDFLERSVYDPQGKAQDVFKYVDDSLANFTGGSAVTIVRWTRDE